MAHASKIILAALAIAGMWFLASWPTQDQADPQIHPAQRSKDSSKTVGLPAPKAATHTALSCEFKPGDALAFRFSQASRFTINPAILMSDDPSQRRAFQPQLQKKTLQTDGWLWRVIDQSEDVWTIAAILDSPHWVVDAEAVDPILTAGLTVPLLFKMDSACQVLKIGFQAKTPPAAVLEHQMALMMSQLVVRKDQISWATRETDTLGRYKAAYSRRSRDVTRIKSEYVAVKRPNPRLKMTARIEKGTSSGRLKDNGRWYQRVNVTDHVIVSAAAGTFADVETTVDIAAVKSPEDHPFFSMKLDVGTYRFVDAHEVAQSKRRRFAGQADPRLAQRDFKSVITEFSALLNSGDNGLKENALKLLVQYLRLDPKHVAELMDSLRDGRFPKHAQSAAFLALELAGGTAVHDALRAAAEDPALSQVNRLRAVTAYADSRDATDDFVQELVKIESRAAGRGDGDMKRSTHLALGTLGGNDSLSKAARVEVSDLLTERLDQADDVADITTSIAALGNQGDGRTADVIKPYLDSEYPAVRNAAYGALQKMEQLPPAADMLDDLVNETSPGVQKRIAESLGKNQDDMDEGNVEKAIALMLDPRLKNEVILVGLIDLLGPISAQNARARQALVSLFRRTRNVTIMQRIGRYVAPQELQ